MIMLICMVTIACSFIYTIIIALIYFFKKRVNNIETKFYSILMAISLLNLYLELMLCVNVLLKVNIDSLLNIFFNRIFLISLFSWVTVFTIYIIKISFGNCEKIMEKITFEGNLLKKPVLIIFIIYIIIMVFLMSILPIEQYICDTYSYSFGPAVNVLIGICVVSSIVWLLCFIFKTDKTDKKKYYPLWFYLGVFIIGIILREINPGILFNSLNMALAVFLMYFTIENPDMKLILELNKAKEEADRANHAKTDFLSNMSHEIRTPLNAIVGFSQVLLSKDLPNEAKEEVNDIVSASESLIEIVNGVLDISKIEANKLELVSTEYSINKILKELVSLTKARLGIKQLEFKTNFDSNIPPILFGDSTRLKQIILNLLTNSVKYTHEGYIEFKVSAVIKNDICRLIISVEDSGIGIQEDKIEKLFTKFERLDQEKNIAIEGTGLGLTITKKLLDLMGGKISVQSIYEKGSRFTVAIDQKIINKDFDESELTEEDDELTDFDGTNIRILMVDDNRLNLKVASKLLTNYNFNIVEVTSGKECLDLIDKGGSFDLILLDDMMPEITGVETFNLLKQKEGFNTPVVALTANAISGMREEYINLGFDDYLSKPISKDELEKIINKFLNKK